MLQKMTIINNYYKFKYLFCKTKSVSYVLSSPHQLKEEIKTFYIRFHTYTLYETIKFNTFFVYL